MRINQGCQLLMYFDLENLKVSTRDSQLRFAVFSILRALTKKISKNRFFNMCSLISQLKEFKGEGVV